jgi:hypothetical protein
MIVVRCRAEKIAHCWRVLGIARDIPGNHRLFRSAAVGRVVETVRLRIAGKVFIDQ